MNNEKTERQLVIMTTIQNVLVTAMWVGLALAFHKWWIGLFSLFTFQTLKYKVRKETKDAD